MTGRGAAWRGGDVAAIAGAVAHARRAVQDAGSADALVFAREYVARGGVRIPGPGADEQRAAACAGVLLGAAGRAGPLPADPDVARELDRVRKESALAHALAPARMVGFLLVIGEDVSADPACQFLLGQDFGLGAAVYPRTRVAVAPPWCLDYRFVPISEDEVEQ